MESGGDLLTLTKAFILLLVLNNHLFYQRFILTGFKTESYIDLLMIEAFKPEMAFA